MSSKKAVHKHNASSQLETFTRRLHNRIHKEMKAIPPGPESGVDHHTVKLQATGKETEASSSEYFVGPLMDLVFEYARPYTLPEAHKLANDAKQTVGTMQADLDAKYHATVATGPPASWNCDKCHKEIKDKAATTVKDRVSYLTLICPACKKETIWMRPPRVDPRTVLGQHRTFAGCARFMDDDRTDTCLCGGAGAGSYESTEADDDAPSAASTATAASVSASEPAGGGGDGSGKVKHAGSLACGVCTHTLAGHFAGIEIDATDWRWYYMFGGGGEQAVEHRALMHSNRHHHPPGPAPVAAAPAGSAPTVVSAASVHGKH